MDVVVQELEEDESLPLHSCHTCVDEAQLDVLGGRSDTITPSFQEKVKGLFW